MKNKDILRLPIFCNHETTLKNASYNDAARRYMTESLLPVVDFDDVKTEYVRMYYFKKSVYL